MVYTNWYPGAPSMTASKYLKYSVAYTKPFEPGQRYRNRRDMELTVREGGRVNKNKSSCMLDKIIPIPA